MVLYISLRAFGLGQEVSVIQKGQEMRARAHGPFPFDQRVVDTQTEQERHQEVALLPSLPLPFSLSDVVPHAILVLRLLPLVFLVELDLEVTNTRSLRGSVVLAGLVGT